MNVVHKADVLDALRAMPDNSFHGCLTDPPYGLSFMGHQWDHGVPSVEVWREVLRVLRPGAHLLAFGGTRTFHRLTCAIEDAGFEIRDCMSWLYGSGFPKSLDVSKAIDREAGAVREVVGVAADFARDGARRKTDGSHVKAGANVGNDPIGDRWGTPVTAPATTAARQWDGHGTALKPAWEPIILARKTLEGTVAANVQAYGTGAINVDGCRVATSDNRTRANSGSKGGGGCFGDSAKYTNDNHPSGRWPANVVLDEEAGAALDAQSGTLRNGGQNATSLSRSPRGASGLDSLTKGTARPGDSGGASRFFYCAKASRAERDAGLEGFAVVTRAEQTRRKEGSAGSKNPAAGSGSTEGGRNVHPTVKPLALTTYLSRLILPPVEGTRLLVPFCGSGSEMIGGLRAGWSHVEGIDSWDVAVRIARARLAHAAAGVP